MVREPRTPGESDEWSSWCELLWQVSLKDVCRGCLESVCHLKDIRPLMVYTGCAFLIWMSEI